MTERLPIFPLRTVLFPGGRLPLHIFEPRYRLMLSRQAGKDPCFGVVLTRSGGEVGDRPEIHEIGTSAVSVERVTLPDGRSNLLVKGARRFRVLEREWDESYMVARITWLDTQDSAGAEVGLRSAVHGIQQLLARYLESYNRATGQRARFRVFDDEPIAFAHAVASTLPMPIETRQRLLEATPPEQLLSLLEAAVLHETALMGKIGAYTFLPGHPGARFSSN